jgi:energy-coupling factor transport system permease protein
LNRQLLEIIPADSIARRIDARTKIATVSIICLMALLIDTPLTLYFLFLLMLMTHLLSKTSAAKWTVLIVIMLASIWGSLASQAIFYDKEPRTPIFCLIAADAARPLLNDGVYLYKEGMVYGALQAMRSCAMLAAGMFLCWSSDARDLLKSLLYWRIPYPLAFMTISSLRFLPDIIGETLTVITAQKLRGFEPMKSARSMRLIQTLYQTLFPVLARTIRRAATLSLSVEARGFGRAAGQNLAMPLWRYERCVIIIFWIFFALLATAKVVYWLQFGGIWYYQPLRPVYDFVKLWL